MLEFSRNKSSKIISSLLAGLIGLQNISVIFFYAFIFSAVTAASVVNDPPEAHAHNKLSNWNFASDASGWTYAVTGQPFNGNGHDPVEGNPAGSYWVRTTEAKDNQAAKLTQQFTTGNSTTYVRARFNYKTNGTIAAGGNSFVRIGIYDNTDTNRIGQEMHNITWASNTPWTTTGWSTLRTLDPNTTYTVRVWMGIRQQNALIAEGWVDNIELSFSPSGLTATAPAGTTNVQLNWDASVPGSGAPALHSTNPYKVYRGGSFLANSTTNSFTDSTTQGNTTYQYYVTDVDENGTESPNSVTVTRLTRPAAPGTPTFTNVSTSSFTVNWTAPSGGADSYKVERAPDSNGSPGAWSEIATGITSLFYNDSGLSPGTSYWYRIRGTNATGDGPYSSSAKQATLPIGPGSITFSNVAAETLTINWTAPPGEADSYIVERAPDLGGAPGAWSEIATGVPDLFYNDSGLSPNSTYWYRVRATSSAGDSEYSPSASQLTLPAAPGIPTFSSVTTSSLTVNWTVPPGGAASYKLERAPDLGGGPGAWSEIATGLTDLFFNDYGLSPNSTYWYRVRATNASGDGQYVTASQLTFPSIAGTPTFSNVRAESLTVNWTAPPGGADSYKVERAPDSGGAPGAWSEIATGITGLFYDDPGLIEGATYWYRVRATNAAGDGEYSENSSQTTNQVPIITSTAPTAAAEGFLYTYPVTAVDPDSDPITYSLTTAPAGMTIDPNTGLIEWTPNLIGDYLVTVRASDGADNDEQSFILTVTDTTPPTITLLGPNPQQIELGEQYSELGATATDNDPAFDGTVTIDASSVNTQVPGSYTVTYTATDPSNNTALATRVVNVGDTTPPTITLLGPNPQQIELGEQYSELGATATDNDPAFDGTVTIDASSVNTQVPGSYTVTYTATDPSNNTALATRVVNVGDTTPPTITLLGPNPQQIELGEQYSELGATATDNDPAFDGTVTIDASSVNTQVPGSYTVTYTATDPSNNTALATRVVNVGDTTPPTITLLGPNPQQIELGEQYSELGATATDNDPAFDGTVTIDASSVNTQVPGSYTVTYTATDPSNNTALATRVVNVGDTTPPTITLLGPNPQQIELGEQYSELGATATDNDPAFDGTVTIDASSVNTQVPGSYTVTYTATDPSNNTALATRVVNVGDTTPPTITLLGPNPQQIELGEQYSELGATATDNDPAFDGTVTIDASSVNTQVPGSYTVTYTATDPSNNTALATRVVNVGDTTPPTITLLGPNPQQIELGEQYSELGATATDNDPAFDGTVTIDASSVNTQVPGSYTVTYTATDPSNNTALATRVVNVGDTTPPTITLLGPNPQQIELGEQYSELGATATDNDPAFDGTVTIDASSVNTQVPGSYTVTYTATDPSNNTALATRVVNVGDTTPPTITLLGPNPQQIELGEQYSELGATATDNDPAFDGTVTIDASSVNTQVPGSYTVTYTATDPSNNTALATRVVNVGDTTPPTITLLGPNPQQIELGEQYSELGATATDNDPAFDGTVTIDASSVNTQVPGSYTVTYTATDPSNNTALATRVVNVVHINKQPNSWLSVPVTNATEGLLYTYTATASDPDIPFGDTLTYTLEVAPATMTIDPASGQINWTPDFNAAPGPYDVTVRATDSGGLWIEQSYQIVVANTNRAPVFISTPVIFGMEGALYTYTVLALDPDGDSVTYSLITAPSEMTIDPITGEITWMPNFNDEGNHLIIIRASDGDLHNDQTYMLVIENNDIYPDISIQYPESFDGSEYLRGRVPLKGSATFTQSRLFSQYLLEYQKIQEPDGTTVVPIWRTFFTSRTMVSDATLGRWDTTRLNGTFNLRLSVYDTNNNIFTDVKNVKVDNVKPTITPLNPILPGLLTNNLNLNIIVTDEFSGVQNEEYEKPEIYLNNTKINSTYNSASSVLTASLDGEPELVTGENMLTVIASDKAGNVNNYSLVFTYEPLTLVQISSPENLDVVDGTYKIPVRGFIRSDVLSNWVLEYKKAADTTWVKAASGTRASKYEMVLGTLPELAIGDYHLRLTATSIVGDIFIDSKTISVQKIGYSDSHAEIAVIQNVANRFVIWGSAYAPDFSYYRIFFKQNTPTPGSPRVVFVGMAPVYSGLLASFDMLANGKYDVIISVYSKTGEIRASYTYSDIDMDTMPPKIQEIKPANFSHLNTNEPTILINAVDQEAAKGASTASGLEDEIDVFINGKQFKAAKGANNWYELTQELAKGLHRLKVQVTDKKGNSTSTNLTYTVDTEAPQAQINNLSSDQMIKGTYVIKGRVFDSNLSAYQIQYHPDIPKGKWVAAATGRDNLAISGSTLANFKSNSLDGKYYIRLVARDMAGNMTYWPPASETSYTEGIPVLVDNRPPTLGPIYPEPNRFLREVTEIYLANAKDISKAGGTDSVAGINPLNIKLKLNNELFSADYDDSTGRVQTIFGAPLQDGVYTANFLVADNLGNTAASKSSRFTVDSTPPLTRLVMPRSAIKTGNKLTISGKVLDKNLKSWTLYQKREEASTYTKIASGVKEIGSQTFNQTFIIWNTPLSEGIYDLKLEAIDKANNFSRDDVKIILDSSTGLSNSAEITYPQNGQMFRGIIPIIGSASTVSNFSHYELHYRTSSGSQVMFYKRANPIESGSLGLLNSSKLNGEYDIILKVFTNPLSPVQFGPDKIVNNIKIDNQPPQVQSILPAQDDRGINPEFIKSNTPQIEIKFADIGFGLEPAATIFRINDNKLPLNFNEGGNSTIEGNLLKIRLPRILEGKYTSTIQLFDKAGNASKVFTYRFIVDVDGVDMPVNPLAAIKEPLNNSYVKSNTPIFGTVYDHNIFSYTLALKRPGAAVFSNFATAAKNLIDDTLGFFKPSINGVHEIKLTLLDQAGNIKEAMINVIADITIPIAVLTKINNTPLSSVSIVSGNITVSGQAYDRGGLNDATDPNDSFAYYKLEYGAGKTPVFWNEINTSTDYKGSEGVEDILGNWNTTLVPNGIYTIKITAYDLAGNQSKISVKTLTVAN